MSLRGGVFRSRFIRPARPQTGHAALHKFGAYRIDATTGGTYTLTGTTATTRYGYVANATTAGSYSLSGTAATFGRSRRLDAATAGSYALTGVTASFGRTWRADAATAGSYSLSGTAATLSLLANKRLDATTAGAYSLSGTAATAGITTAGLTLAAAAGSYGITGTLVTVGRGLFAGSGSYSLTGTAASPAVGGNLTLVAAAASYAFSGTSAFLRKSGMSYYLAASNTVDTTTATVTSSAFTPNDNALLVAVAPGWVPGVRTVPQSITDSVGLTWTQRVFREDMASGGGNFPTTLAIWTAQVGTGSPSMTVTVNYGNPTATDANGKQSVFVIEVVGHSVSSPIAQTFSSGSVANYNSAYSGAFSAAPASSGLVIAAVSIDDAVPNDASNIDTGSGWTQVAEQFAGNPYNTSQVQARTGSTSTAVLWDGIDADYSFSAGAIEIAVSVPISIIAGSGSYSITGSSEAFFDKRGTHSIIAAAGSYEIVGAEPTFDHDLHRVLQTGLTLQIPVTTGETPHTVSSTIYVPPDTQLVVVGLSGFHGSGGGFTTGFSSVSFTKGGVDTPMTPVTGGDPNSSWNTAMWYLAAPDVSTTPTDYKSLKSIWATGALDPLLNYSITFWRGVRTLNPVTDSDASAADAPPHLTPLLTAQERDKIIAFAGFYNALEDGSGQIDTWTNLTEVTEIPHLGHAEGAWASGDPLEPTAVGWSAATNTAEGGIAAIVVRPSSLYTYQIDGNAGSYSMTGDLVVTGQSLLTNSAFYLFVGDGVTNNISTYFMVAKTRGLYALSGSPASYFRLRVLTALPGSYAMTGTAATLTYTGVPPPQPQPDSDRLPYWGPSAQALREGASIPEAIMKKAVRELLKLELAKGLKKALSPADEAIRAAISQMNDSLQEMLAELHTFADIRDIMGQATAALQDAVLQMIRVQEAAPPEPPPAALPAPEDGALAKAIQDLMLVTLKAPKPSQDAGLTDAVKALLERLDAKEEEQAKPKPQEIAKHIVDRIAPAAGLEVTKKKAALRFVAKELQREAPEWFASKSIRDREKTGRTVPRVLKSLADHSGQSVADDEEDELIALLME